MRVCVRVRVCVCACVRACVRVCVSLCEFCVSSDVCNVCFLRENVIILLAMESVQVSYFGPCFESIWVMHVFCVS